MKNPKRTRQRHGACLQSMRLVERRAAGQDQESPGVQRETFEEIKKMIKILEEKTKMDDDRGIVRRPFDSAQQFLRT